MLRRMQIWHQPRHRIGLACEGRPPWWVWQKRSARTSPGPSVAGRSSGQARAAAGSTYRTALPHRVRAEAARRLEAHRRWLAEHEPRLVLSVTPETASAEISGTIRVRIGAGISREFEVQMVFQRTRRGDINPARPPDTYEIGGRFPREADRHIEPDGRWCMWHPLDEPRDFDRPRGLELHLDRVRQFILLQLAYEDRKARGLTPFWQGFEWLHGAEGHRQWVREHCNNIATRCLRPLALEAHKISTGEAGVTPYSRCLCGSPRAWKNCHAEWASKLATAIRLYPQPILDELLDMMKEHNDHP